MRSSKKLLFSLAMLLLSYVAAHAGEPGNQIESTEKAVVFLIDQVAKSHLTFIRNGIEYSGQEAADHIRYKYERCKSRIKSPEDFIHFCASRSLVSGNPYLVSTPHGTVPVEKWLGEILKEYEKKQNLSWRSTNVSPGLAPWPVVWTGRMKFVRSWLPRAVNVSDHRRAEGQSVYNALLGGGCGLYI